MLQANQHEYTSIGYTLEQCLRFDTNVESGVIKDNIFSGVQCCHEWQDD